MYSLYHNFNYRFYRGTGKVIIPRRVGLYYLMKKSLVYIFLSDYCNILNKKFLEELS